MRMDLVNHFLPINPQGGLGLSEELKTDTSEMNRIDLGSFCIESQSWVN